MNSGKRIDSTEGNLAVLTPGMGAVATTLFAGVEAVRRGLASPIGSMTQIGKIRLGDRDENRFVPVSSLLPLAPLESLVFGGWDLFPQNAYETAIAAKVIEPALLERLRSFLESIRPMEAVFDPEWLRRLNGTHVKKAPNKMDLAQALRHDIREFRRVNRCSRAVMIWCGSTEVYPEGAFTGASAGASVGAFAGASVYETIRSFERGLEQNDPAISPSQIYCYAALKESVPYANGSPNVSVEIPALQHLALEMSVPIAGSDFKTGQTLLKTVIAPGLRKRLLGLSGWYSTNILGNRDGEVLDDPGSFKSKEVTKTGVLTEICSPELYPDLYSDVHHVVRIQYYPPRGDNKEGWDNIDLFGWLGYPMQIKVNFLCRDSILAAPVVLDLAIFLDLASRAGLRGIQEWLSFYFKAPLSRQGLRPEHDLSVQSQKLENTLRFLAGEKLIHHLGLSYYGVNESEAVL